MVILLSVVSGIKVGDVVDEEVRNGVVVADVEMASVEVVGVMAVVVVLLDLVVKADVVSTLSAAVGETMSPVVSLLTAALC